MTNWSDYCLFGLRVRSAFPLPELAPATHAEPPDVTITFGRIDRPMGMAGLEPVDGGLLLSIDEVGRYLICNGTEILIDAIAGTDPRNIRLFLLGSAFGALLHQRGLLPLHANAVEIDGRAVAFMGESGAGKSTLTAWFHDQGHRVLADDVCVVRFAGDGRPLAFPGVPRVRLWRDALDALGRNHECYRRSFSGDEDYDKFDVPLTFNALESLPLNDILVLERGDRLRIDPLTDLAAVEAVFAHTYRGAFVHVAESAVEHWRQCVQLVQQCRVATLTRSWSTAKFDVECRDVVRYLELLD